MSYLELLVSLVCDRANNTIGIPYEQSETYRRQDGNLNYPDETDMINNHSYSPLPTPSGSTGGPGRIQPLPPVSRDSSRANLDLGSPYAGPSIREDAYTTGAGSLYHTAPGYPSVTPSIRDDSYRTGAEYDYARQSAREDSRMDPRREDPYRTGTRYSNKSLTGREDPYSASAGYGYARPSGREDPHMPPRREDPYRTDAEYGYARMSGREDPRMVPRRRDPHSTGTGYDYAEREDPRMPPRRLDPRHSPDRRDSVLGDSSATTINAGLLGKPHAQEDGGGVGFGDGREGR